MHGAGHKQLKCSSFKSTGPKIVKTSSFPKFICRSWVAFEEKQKKVKRLKRLKRY